jgi:hypothetical protein
VSCKKHGHNIEVHAMSKYIIEQHALSMWAFNHDDSLLASGSYGAIVLWRFQDDKEVKMCSQDILDMCAD